jgi:hypothetical protein
MFLNETFNMYEDVFVRVYWGMMVVESTVQLHAVEL